MKNIRSLLLFLAMGAITCIFINGNFLHRMLRTERHERFDKPGESDRFFYQQRLYPHDIVPSHWYENAIAHINTMEAVSFSKRAETWSWVSLGPTNIAGRVRAMAMDPNNPDVLYAGSAGGGVWKTTNGGIVWQPLSDFVPNLRIGSIAVHPTNSNIIIAGNGEGFVVWQDGMAYGRGIYRSKDAGSTWELLPTTENQNFEYVFDVAFDPFEPDIILASTRRGIMRSSDGGDTWTKLSLTSLRGMMTVFSKTTPGLVYAAIEGSGVYRSEDHGLTWTAKLNSGLSVSSFSRVQIAAAPSNGDVVYAAFTARDESCAGIFKTTNRGALWIKLSTPINDFDGETYMRSQGSYNSVLTVHPSKPQIVWAGGIDLYVSSDGGVTWKQKTNWYSSAGYTYVHADQHALLLNPVDPQKMYAGCDGGVFRSVNGGTNFADANSGLVTLQFHSGTPHPSSDLMLGGSIDNGTLKVSNGTRWNEATGGDGGYTAIDYNDPRTMFAEIYYLEFLKSTNYGNTFQQKLNGIPKDANGGTTDRVGFIAPFEMDPTNPKILYAGTYRLYKTINAAELWTPISPDLTGSTYGTITAIGLSKSSGSTIYTGSSTGAVFVTTDAGTNWVRSLAGLPNRYVTDIAVSATDPATAYLTVSGFASGHVYRTTNTGQSWMDISGSDPASLPDVPANTVVVHPSNPQRLFVGTDVGVFCTYDGGQTWIVNNTNMGNVTVADLQFRKDGTLFAATHGRGAFKSDFSLLDSQRLPGVTEFALAPNFPNPVSATTQYTTSIHYTLPKQTSVDIEFFNAAGQLVYTEHVDSKSPGSYRMVFRAALLEAGVYYYRLRTNTATSAVHKMIVVK